MTYHDEFDDPEGLSPFGRIARALENGRTRLHARAPFLAVVTGVAALFVLFAVFWYSYPRGDDPSRPVPLVKADADIVNSAYKSVPDDPGGMDIPYRDSTLFDTLRSANNAEGGRKIENLLPPAEEPMPRAQIQDQMREQMFAGLKTETLSGDDGETRMAETDVTAPDNAARMMDDDLSVDAKPANTPVNDIEKTGDDPGPKPTSKPELKPEVRIADTKVEEKAAATEPAAGAAAPTVKAVKDGTHFVQMASVKDDAAARSEWKKMQAAFPAQLGNIELRVQKADLGEKGVFYRIQGGPVTQDQAKSICAAITAKRPGGCLVVAR